LAQTSGNNGWLSSGQQNGGQRRKPTANANTGDRQMKTLSFILAFAFVLAGPSLAGSTDNLPGIGTFAYNGTPIVTSAPHVIMVATR
jgi:hypothetical protein